MKNKTDDINKMLDALSLPIATQQFKELSESPELGNYSSLQFMHEVLET